MKKFAFTLTVIALALVAAGLSATLETPVAPTETQLTSDAAPVCASGEALPFGSAPMWMGPNYCGDPCFDPGAQIGCIDQGSNPWRRTICTCWNGFLTC